MARKLFTGILGSSLDKFRKFGSEQKRKLKIKSSDPDRTNTFGLDPEQVLQHNGGENEMFTKEQIEQWAKDAYVAKQVEKTRSILAESLTNIELGSPEMLGGKTAQEYLTIFDQAIDSLSNNRKKGTRADEKKVINELNSKFQQIINLYSQLIANVDQITENNAEFNKINQDILDALQINITLSSGKTISSLEEALQYIKKVNIKNGQRYKIEHLTEKEVNKIVGLLVSRRKYLKEKNPKDKSISQIDDLLELMKLIVENPKLIEDYKKRFGFDEDLTAKNKQKFEKEIEDKIKEIEQTLKNLLENVKNSERYSNDYQRLINECESITNRYSSLDKNYCTNFIEQKINEVHQKLGQDKIEFANKYNQRLIKSINLSRSVDFTHQSFEELRQRTITLISEMIREGSKIGLKIEFDEENQKCIIHHSNKTEEFQIINDEALKDYKDSKKQTGEKQKQKEECKKEWDNYYKSVVKEIEDSINKLQHFIEPTEPIMIFRYPNLTVSEIEDIRLTSEREAYDKFYAKYGKEFIDYCLETAKKIDGIKILLSNLLSNVENNASLKDDYDQVISQLMDIKNGIDSKYITKFDFNEKTGVLEIEYAGNKFNSYHGQIIPKELLAKVVKTTSQGNNKDQEIERCKKEWEEYFEKAILKIKKSLQTFEPIEPIVEPSSTYSLLSNDEVEQIKEEAEKSKYDPFIAQYGEDFINYSINLVKQIVGIKKELITLNNTKENNPNVKQEYDQIIARLENIVNTIDKKYISKISFTKETGMFEVEYVGNKLNSYKGEIVPKELIAKVSTITPPTPTPTSDEEERDIKLYVDLVKEINQKITEINDLNTRVLLGDLNSVDGVINSENKAQSLDKDVVNLRVNISKLRTDFIVKYKTYMLSNETVKNAKIETIQFNGTPFESLVDYQDALIQEAEERIIELANERKDKSPEEVAKINDEMKRLLTYIEAKNSLVNRSLVEKCRQNPQFDLLAFLKKRRENKKEWREKLKMIKNNQDVPSQSQPPSSQPSTPTQENEGPSVRMEVPNGTVDPNRRLSFNPRKKVQLINKEKDFIGLADSVTISLINSGIKVKYSQQLKQKLSALNAKLSLVNKQNYRVRTSQKIADDVEDQEVRFKDQRDLLSNDEYKNYKVEIRIPSESGKASDVLYEYDFDDQEPHIHR